MKKALLALALLVAGAASADAQVKNRWRLTWSNEKPRIFTYRTPDDRWENYWYVVYTIENPSELNGQEVVPLIHDILLYVETGKELQHDILRVDVDTNKAVKEAPRKAESLKYGRFHANIIDPEVEYRIIEDHAKIGNRSDGIIRESIENFKKGFTDDPPAELGGRWKKGDRVYLNPAEIRQARFILPGQKIGGIAIFKNVDPRATVYELHVSGLVDIVKLVTVSDDEWKMEYEPWVMKLRYLRQGDPYEIERDVVLRQPRAPEYVVKRLGPVASKDTVDKLVMTLADALKREQGWRADELPADKMDQERKKHAIDTLDGRIIAMVFKTATNKDFGYDGTKTILENEQAIWRIHEWWLTNRSKLVFDEVQNRFVIKDDPLPGAVQK